MTFDLFKWIKERKPHYLKWAGECHEWQSTVQNNHPRICIKKVFYWPRSEMYAKTFGGYHKRSSVVTLTCKNPRCLNPKHMVLAQKQANQTIFGCVEKNENSMPGNLRGTLKYIFENWPAKIRREGHCFLWVKNLTSGAPYLYRYNRRIALRSTIYAEHFGEFDKKRFQVKMTCGENGCLNPVHMELRLSNVSLKNYYASEHSKNAVSTMRRSMNNRNRKLSFADVQEIRKSNESNRALGKKYNVWHSTIQSVKSYKTFCVVPSAFGILKVA